MTFSTDFITTAYYCDKNKNGTPYTIVHLFDRELLLFNNMVFRQINQNGDICVSVLIDNQYDYKYKIVGKWNNIENGIELTIFGKGIFYLVKNNDVACHIHEAKTTSPLEQLAINAIKSQPSILDS